MSMIIIVHLHFETANTIWLDVVHQAHNQAAINQNRPSNARHRQAVQALIVVLLTPPLSQLDMNLAKVGASQISQWSMIEFSSIPKIKGQFAKLHWASIFFSKWRPKRRARTAMPRKLRPRRPVSSCQSQIGSCSCHHHPSYRLS